MRRISRDGDLGKLPGLGEARTRSGREVDREAFYEALAAEGFKLGPAFQTVRRVWVGERELVAEVALDQGVTHEASRYGIHPTLLDAFFQVTAALVPPEEGATDPLLATRLDRLRILEGVGDLSWVHATATSRDGDTITLDARGYDDAGHVVAELRGLAQTRTRRKSLGRVIAEDEWSYGIDWREADIQERLLDATGSWLVLEDARGTAELVTAALEERGAKVYRCAFDEGGGRAEADVWVADPSTPNWADRLLDELAGRGEGSFSGIVSLLGVDASSSRAEADEVMDRSVTTCGVITDVVRAVSRRSPLAGKLLLVTRGAVDAGPRSTSHGMEVGTSALWACSPCSVPSTPRSAAESSIWIRPRKPARQRPSSRSSRRRTPRTGSRIAKGSGWCPAWVASASRARRATGCSSRTVPTW